ncbi:hypothetical protein Nmel_018012, partial [Mimus melanotis]
ELPGRISTPRQNQNPTPCRGSTCSRSEGTCGKGDFGMEELRSRCQWWGRAKRLAPRAPGASGAGQSPQRSRPLSGRGFTPRQELFLG